MNDIALTSVLFFFIALLYSTVGHAGASGYLAAMALFSYAPAEMKPAALALNIVVALVTTARFYQAGHFSWPLLRPFALASAPMAYLGGSLGIPAGVYKLLVGVALLFAAIHLVLRSKTASGQNGAEREPGTSAALLTGGIIGFLSGLTGVGGGIFLSPVLLLMNWAGLRKTAAVSAAFILLNSLAGLAGHVLHGGALPAGLGIWSVSVIAGGFIGSTLGATRLNSPALRFTLGAVLAMAGMKLVVI